MKKILLITLSFLAVTVKAQTNKPIDGVMGIKFGSSYETAAAAVKAKGGTISEDSKPTSMVVEDIKLGSRKPDYMVIYFVENKMYGARLSFQPELQPQLVDYYNSLASDLTGVYGKGNAIKKFKPPYEEGDGYEVQAITTGNADFLTYWSYENNKIYLMPKPDGRIDLSYMDGNLYEIVSKQEKEKEKADF